MESLLEHPLRSFPTIGVAHSVLWVKRILNPKSCDEITPELTRW